MANSEIGYARPVLIAVLGPGQARIWPAKSWRTVLPHVKSFSMEFLI